MTRQPAPDEVLLYPLITEKVVALVEAQNKLAFVVHPAATKPLIRRAVEKAFSVKVRGLNVLRDRKGRKKAIVQLHKDHKASEIALKLGVM